MEGVVVQDETGTLSPSSIELRGNVVINATGPWSDELREKVGGAPKLRRLRGSHLVLPSEKLPIQAAITLLHPRDNRALFAIPWEGRTIVGTTDLDHDLHEEETRITRDELTYLLEVAEAGFPELSAHGIRCHRHLFRLAPNHQHQCPNPLPGVTRSCGLGRRRPGHHHRRKTDHLPGNGCRCPELLPGAPAE